MGRLGDRLKLVRGKLSREEFAKQTGVSKTSIQNYESGRPEPGADFIRRACEGFGIEESWLVSGRGPMRRSDIAPAGMAETRAVFREATIMSRPDAPLLVRGLLALLPPQGAQWPAAEREKWLKAVSDALNAMYR